MTLDVATLAAVVITALGGLGVTAIAVGRYANQVDTLNAKLSEIFKILDELREKTAIAVAQAERINRLEAWRESHFGTHQK